MSNNNQDIDDFFPISCHYGRIRCEEEGLAQASLVKLDCLQEEEAVTLLSKQERDYFQRFHHAKRRREWLGGRAAAKIALLRQHDAEAMRRNSQLLTVLPDEYGRPAVTGQAAVPSRSLSISHSGEYAVALAAQGNSCGIDLQKISDKLPSLTAYFASAHELEMLNTRPEIGDYATSLTMLWAVKESVKKSVLSDKATTFAAIELKQIMLTEQGSWQFNCTVQHFQPQAVRVHHFFPYILALTTASF